MSQGSPEVIPFDLARMFLGDTSPLFLLEIAFRTALMFLWLVFLLRVTGKRGLAQLSPLELAIVIGLGSAAGDPMFYPEVPLLHAMLVLALVVVFQRLLSFLVIRSERVETFVEGKPVELVRDGVIFLSALAQANLSREDLFERLRAQGVRQLGEVQRVYFEQDGNLSVFSLEEDPPAGLAIVPPWDLELPPPVLAGAAYVGALACLQCGTTQRMEAEVRACPSCEHAIWTPATTDPLGGTGKGKRGGQSGDRSHQPQGGGSGPGHKS
ncbi:DUF421 domain-containing protein [Deinococcus hopiensis]|uniref:Uncharacterized membrane protein YcaP, DUF421 family n=1 Tax=Deinococcus hopiensis KR-140 TaxID=695939 RepID=A0A1W1UK77_9DEIO|nr:DUF421 domain-containing protein [Deinococcus hopiensis]SMB81154.1 Uncharacterized membrane protein YcaP, DUF421 family [Deinococcus hopiensis KR-140]